MMMTMNKSHNKGEKMRQTIYDDKYKLLENKNV